MSVTVLADLSILELLFLELLWMLNIMDKGMGGDTHVESMA